MGVVIAELTEEEREALLDMAEAGLNATAATPATSVELSALQKLRDAEPKRETT